MINNIEDILSKIESTILKSLQARILPIAVNKNIDYSPTSRKPEVVHTARIGLRSPTNEKTIFYVNINITKPKNICTICTFTLMEYKNGKYIPYTTKYNLDSFLESLKLRLKKSPSKLQLEDLNASWKLKLKKDLENKSIDLSKYIPKNPSSENDRDPTENLIPAFLVGIATDKFDNTQMFFLEKEGVPLLKYQINKKDLSMFLGAFGAFYIKSLTDLISKKYLLVTSRTLKTSFGNFESEVVGVYPFPKKFSSLKFPESIPPFMVNEFEDGIYYSWAKEASNIPVFTEKVKMILKETLNCTSIPDNAISCQSQSKTIDTWYPGHKVLGPITISLGSLGYIISINLDGMLCAGVIDTKGQYEELRKYFTTFYKNLNKSQLESISNWIEAWSNL